MDKKEEFDSKLTLICHVCSSREIEAKNSTEKGKIDLCCLECGAIYTTIGEMVEKYDPIEEVNKAELCMHCIHHEVCFLYRKLFNLEQKINNSKMGYGFSRKFGEIAEVCKKYKRIIR